MEAQFVGSVTEEQLVSLFIVVVGSTKWAVNSVADINKQNV